MAHAGMGCDANVKGFRASTLAREEGRRMRMIFNFHTLRIQKKDCKCNCDIRSPSAQKRRSLVTGANGTAIDGRISAGEKLDAMSLKDCTSRRSGRSPESDIDFH